MRNFFKDLFSREKYSGHNPGPASPPASDHEGTDWSRQIDLDIHEYGLQVLLIPATDYLPAFAYSIGLWKKFSHPEIICFDLSHDTLHTIINLAADIVKRGGQIVPGQPYDEIFQNFPAFFIPVDPRNIPDYFGTAISYYKGEYFTALQLIWSDRENRLPWNPEFDETMIFRQPLLDRNADFKYREAHNVGIFTTRGWLDNNEPILRVIHSIDGDWQFLTAEWHTRDVVLVALKCIVDRDKSLNDVFNLDYGEYAERTEIGGRWMRGREEIKPLPAG